MPNRNGATGPLPVAERYWPKVAVGSFDECWPWVGHVDQRGYGRIKIGGLRGRAAHAHRVGYELQVGPIPEGLVIDHLCRNRACQNARHLEPVTMRENTLRGEPGKYQTKRTHCPRGHAYSPENTLRDGNRRRCRACVRAYDKRRRAALKPFEEAQP